MRAVSKRFSSVRFAIGATVIGNTLEWFDFALMGALAPLFSGLFFPKGSSLAHPLFFLALSALARPIGGYFFGRLGDRKGRKNALIKTITLMTLPIFMLYLLPSYSHIGVAATIFLGLICLLQGFCTGGEFPGSVVFLVETASVKHKASVGSWAYFGALLGMMFSAIDIYFINGGLSSYDFSSWGWRLPFLLGTILGVIAIFLRRLLHETPVFNEEVERGSLIKDPFLTSFKNHKQALLKGLGIFMLDAVGFNLIIVFSSSYFTEILKLSFTQAFSINMFTIFMTLVFIPIGGKLSDKIGSKTQAKWATGTMIIIAYPAYQFMNPEAIWTIYVAQGILAMVLSMYFSNLPAIVCKLFPPQVRYTSSAIVINFSVALFGGTAPLFAIFLINWLHIPSLPSLYLICAAIISFYSLGKYRDETLS